MAMGYTHGCLLIMHRALSYWIQAKLVVKVPKENLLNVTMGINFLKDGHWLWEESQASPSDDKWLAQSDYWTKVSFGRWRDSERCLVFISRHMPPSPSPRSRHTPTSNRCMTSSNIFPHILIR